MFVAEVIEALEENFLRALKERLTNTQKQQ